MLEILQPDGSLAAGATAPLDDEETRLLFAALVAIRAYDRKGNALQKQGRLATYASFAGQEAAQIGAVAALKPDDWLVASYRDAGAMWFHGYPWVNLFLGRTGDERGGSPPVGVNIMPPSITVGAHMIHAVGLAWGERFQSRDRVAMTLFGEGATSEGDFHEAMNFAGVYQLPVVFLCQNNQYAISMPRAEQTASETIAQKADGYGFGGDQVDGNDLYAVYSAARTAVDRARSGGGPTLIEAVTLHIATTPKAQQRRYPWRLAPVTFVRETHALARDVGHAHLGFEPADQRISGGRCWVRTSDFCRVRARFVLKCSNYQYITCTDFAHL